MRHELHLLPISGNLPPLIFGWDDESGELWGRDAAYIRILAERATDSGEVRAHPYPSFYPVKEPLKDKTEFAAMVGFSYRLPDFLQAHYPEISSDTSDENTMN